MGALIRATYHLLGLQTYFTAGEKEVRAWTIHAGDTAPKAAGVIHSDFERGFIKAETVSYDELVHCGSVAAAREKGLYRMEGKDYVVADGDVLLSSSTCDWSRPQTARVRRGRGDQPGRDLAQQRCPRTPCPLR